MLVNAQNNSNNNQQESSSNDCIEIKDNISIQLPLVKKVTSTTIPSNITQDLKDKVNKLIEIFLEIICVSSYFINSIFKWI